MGSLVKCSIIIYDDFGNVLLAERGKRMKEHGGFLEKILKEKKLMKNV